MVLLTQQAFLSSVACLIRTISCLVSLPRPVTLSPRAVSSVGSSPRAPTPQVSEQPSPASTSAPTQSSSPLTEPRQQPPSQQPSTEPTSSPAPSTIAPASPEKPTTVEEQPKPTTPPREEQSPSKPINVSRAAASANTTDEAADAAAFEKTEEFYAEVQNEQGDWDPRILILSAKYIEEGEHDNRLQCCQT